MSICSLPEKLEEFESIGHIEIRKRRGRRERVGELHQARAVRELFREFEVRILAFPVGIKGHRIFVSLAAFQTFYVLQSGPWLIRPCCGRASARVHGAVRGSRSCSSRSEALLARRGHRVGVVSPGPPPAWLPWPGPASNKTSSANHRSSRRRTSAWRRSGRPPGLLLWRAPAVPFFTFAARHYEGSFTFYADRREEIEAAYRAPTAR